MYGFLGLDNIYHLNVSSQLSQVKYGVPQGSVLGPLLISIFMLPLVYIIRKYWISFHCYSDEIQLFVNLESEGAK